MQYFVTESGLIAYLVKFGKTLVLGDPIFTTNMETIRREFIKSFLTDFSNAVFTQTSRSFSVWMHTEFNFFATSIGTERILFLQTWKISGSKKQNIRTANNQASKKNICIKENSLEESFLEVSAKWLATRKVKSKEIRFLVRKFPNFEEETRRFCAYDAHNNLIAFIIFDPIYSDAKCIGYVPNISRSSEDFSQGIFYAIMFKAIECFREEGKEILNLGLAPLELRGNTENFESPNFLGLLRFLRKHTTSLYNYTGIEYTKSRFLDLKKNSEEGVEKSMFLCHQNKIPILELIAIFRASNVI